MTDAERRRSRLPWPTRTEPTTTPAGTHDHKIPALHTSILYGCILVLIAVNVGLVVYLMTKGAQRDAAEEQVQEQIRDSWCTALDALPEGALLDQLRSRYGCGPGVPLEQLPDDIRRRYEGEPAPTPAPATTAPTPTTQPPPGSPAVPNPPRPTPNEPPAGNSPKPSPPAERGTPLEPVTDTVYGLLPVCPEEIP